jgi:hypothetical protein
MTKRLPAAKLPTETVQDLKVGDLLRNSDREARVFGRITRIGASRNGWTVITYDPDDKE